ncbi:MAG: helix-turn-helix domain-containing protein [Holdemania filiformis]
MNKEEKMEIVRFLDHKGAFLITKSGDKICAFLDISKFTLYSYLDTIRKEDKE